MNNVNLIYIINKLNIMPKSILLFLLALSAAFQHAEAQQGSPLDEYIRLGLDSNLALHQRNFDLSRAQLDLKRAKSLFYPQAGFSSQYTLANGGRTQEIPIGDLLNGVYSSLNQLTGSNKFPQVANQSIQFLPNDFHDTKMEVTVPILNTELLHNKEVTSETINTRRADRDVYRRDLVRNIRQAYYQYLQAGKAEDIYATALLLVKENLRVSQKFVENNMATREVVLRAQAQVSGVRSSLIESGNDRRNAAAYFNFLLNRPLENPIRIDSSLMTWQLPAQTADQSGSGQPISATVTLPGFPSFAAATATASPAVNAGREEFSRLRSYQQIIRSNLKWDRNYLIPQLNAFYDVGYQGFGFHFNGTQFYQLAGINLVWPLFKAGDNKYKIQQARIDIDAIDEQYSQLTAQLTLEQQITVNNYNSSFEALLAQADEVSSAREAYRLAEKRFDEGQALQVELIDARTQMTSAEIRYSQGRLAALNRAADLERVTASYKL
jgi:outer membrane protein